MLTQQRGIRPVLGEVGVPEGYKSDKIRLRGELLSARRARSAAVRAAADTALVSVLLDLIRGTEAEVVAAYVPMPGEPGGARLPDALSSVARRVLLPVVLDDLDLDWVVYAARAALLPAGRGVLEPVGPRLGPAAIAEADLVVVPAVAVDRAGMRLGRGGGSFDRALARVSAPTVALLYEGELVEALPTEAHDRPVSAAIVASGGAGASPFVYWTRAAPMAHHWHSKYSSANDGG
jgi:5-formyltetrahydrofolate cyclo-ligase